MNRNASPNWKRLPFYAVTLISGILVPFLLYRHSSFFGWSAPRGGELLTIASFLTFVGVAAYFLRKNVAALMAVLFFLLGGSIGFFSPWLLSDPYWAKPDVKTPAKIWEVKRVAHSGGSVNGLTYTNSLQALDENKVFFDYLEIDFLLTSDGHLVCLHSWGEEIHKALFGERLNTPVSLAEFREANEGGFLTACDLESLTEWVNNNPSKWIITDIKEPGRNVELLADLIENHDVLASRLIPQAYTFEETYKIKELGFRNIILTTYRMGRLDEGDFLGRASSAPIFAVTMTSGQAGFLSSELNKIGIPTYVFTVNDPEWFAKLRDLGVSNVYTDVLSDTIDGY